MSAELDAQIDAARDKLIKTANIQVGMGNYRQIKRAYEEILLELTNVVDELNAELGKEGEE